jgi:hypothetical protein
MVLTYGHTRATLELIITSTNQLPLLRHRSAFYLNNTHNEDCYKLQLTFELLFGRGSDTKVGPLPPISLNSLTAVPILRH